MRYLRLHLFEIPPDYTLDKSSSTRDPQSWSTAFEGFRGK
jgi:hypothetical protein